MSSAKCDDRKSSFSKRSKSIRPHGPCKSNCGIPNWDGEFITDKDKRLQLEGIRELGKFEAWAVANAREDEKEFRAMTNQQLDERLLTILGEAIGFDFTVVDAAEEDIDPDVCPDCVGEARVMERMLLDEGASEEMVVRMTARARCPLHRDLGQIGAAGRDNGS